MTKQYWVYINWISIHIYVIYDSTNTHDEEASNTRAWLYQKEWGQRDSKTWLNSRFFKANHQPWCSIKVQRKLKHLLCFVKLLTVKIWLKIYWKIYIPPIQKDKAQSIMSMVNGIVDWVWWMILLLILSYCVYLNNNVWIFAMNKISTRNDMFSLSQSRARFLF